MSWLSDLFGGKKESYQPRDLLDPQQRALYNAIGSYYNRAFANGGFPQYTGDYAAPMNEAETKAISNQGDLANAYAGWRSKFTPGYIDPEIENATKTALNRSFYGYGSDPGAKALAEEQYAGPGGYWGGARAQGVMNAYDQGVTRPYDEWRAKALQDSYTNALNYATTGGNVNTVNQQLQSVPRLIEQYGLNQKYNEWIRTRPETSDNIRNALSFIDLTTTAQEYQPGENSNWGGLGSIIGTGLGIIGAPFTGGASLAAIPALSAAGGSIGGLFDNNTGGSNNLSGLNDLLSNLRIGSRANALNLNNSSYAALRDAILSSGNVDKLRGIYA